MGSNYCELFVVRHGQTEANSKGLLQGHLDTPLDDTGIRQAHAIAERLKSEHFDKVFCSDLERAVHTARIILKYHHELEIEKTPELRERNLGILQGKYYKDLIVEYPEIMQSFKRDMQNVLVPGGESIEKTDARLGGFMNRIAKEFPGKKILIITHGGALQCMFHHAVGRTSEENIRPFSGNASLNIFRSDGTSWQLVTWNECSHLKLLEQKETLTY